MCRVCVSWCFTYVLGVFAHTFFVCVAIVIAHLQPMSIPVQVSSLVTAPRLSRILGAVDTIGLILNG